MLIRQHSARYLISRRLFVPVAQQLISSFDDNISATHWTDCRWNAEWLDNTMRLRTFPDTSTHSPCMSLPRTAWVPFRTGLGRFRSCLYKWGMAPSAACECGAEDQTVDEVVLQCPIHRPPWSAWPDGSGWRDNRMAAQHLPRDLVRSSTGLKNWLKGLRRRQPYYYRWLISAAWL